LSSRRRVNSNVGPPLLVEAGNKVRWKVFTIGLLCTLLLFVVANIYSYAQAAPPCCHFYAPFGVPFPLGQIGGYFGGAHFIFSGLILDLLIALLSSVFFGWFLARFWSEGLGFLNRFVIALKAWHETRL
jgi:hypothetical protein